MSFLCTTINKEVTHHQCVNECQYIFKSACIDKMNEAYNQALEDLLKVCGGGIHEGDCEICTFAIFRDDIRIGCELSKRIK